MARDPDDTARRRALGEQLATFREAAGLTQGQLAARVFVDRTTIAHLERGRSNGGPDRWQALDAAVDAGGALTDAYTALVADRHQRERHAQTNALAKVRARADQLRRRAEHGEAQAAQGAAYLAATGPLSTGEGPAGLVSLAAIRAMSGAFQLADRQLGGGVLYGQIVRYIRAEIAPTLLDPPQGIHTSDLFSAAASFAEIAGWMAHDGGHNGKARAHFGHAYHLATAAHNPALSANICASLAHLAVQLGQADDAIRIASAGLPRATHQPGAGHLVARLHAMRARGLALQRKAIDCQHALAAANHALNMSESDSESAVEWLAGFDRASLAAESAHCLYTLGQLAHAETEARTVIALRNGDRVRSRALGQLTLAHILHQSGQIAEAATIATHVAEIAPTLNSARVHDGIHALTKTLASKRSVPEVDTFIEAATALATQAIPPHTPGWPL